MCWVQLWYSLAKTLAEREAFKFAAEEELDLVTINPSFVVGPFVTPAPTSSVSLILNLLNGIHIPLFYENLGSHHSIWKSHTHSILS